jgi:4-aminobutyrate aminotransferase/(S)-3-amino-2-methylpropionate transaminase
MSDLSAGDQLPRITVSPPGPQSRRLAATLQRYESPNVTYISDEFPIFWREARGANVLDVDGNIYIDLSAGFGVAAAGHGNPRVTEAVKRQLDLLAHGMGDVHPPEIKVATLERLAEITPGDLSQAVLSSSGSEAVESALKTARLASGRPGVLCFRGAYHGLTYGALAVTDGEFFRGSFRDQLGIPTARVPFPDPYRPDPEVAREPILGRGGIVVPPDGFLRGLREECDRRDLILIFDEVYTGFGRTGRWFACQHEDVVPDIICLGKALSGALPFSACIGRPEIMAAWPSSAGEAFHTSTFLGHPLGCAAALAHIDEIEAAGLIERSARLGAALLESLEKLRSRVRYIGDVRGRGLLAAVELVRDPGARPDPVRAARVVKEALRSGLILLAGDGVIELSPPLTITEGQLDFALSALEACLARA